MTTLDALVRQGETAAPSTDRIDEYWFDAKTAELAVRWIERNLVHPKGSLRGEPYHLAEWEIRDVVAPLFGWKRRSDNMRRFRRVFVAVARGNDKTPLLGAIANLMAVADGEPEPDIYFAAADKKQVLETIFRDAAAMISAGRLGGEIEVLKELAFFARNHATFKVLSSRGATKHGFRPHGIFIDELHAWPWNMRELFDALTTSLYKRRQALLAIATTAGDDTKSLCHEVWDEAESVRRGEIDAPDILPVIYSVPREADWTDERNWALANPNLGRSVRIEDLRIEFDRARRSPRSENVFRRLHLNQWVAQATRWIPLWEWDTGGDAIGWRDYAPLYAEELRARPCFMGVDLALVHDLSAVALYFPPDEDNPRGAVLAKGYLPDDDIQKRSDKDRARYEDWVEQGFCGLTPGKSTNHDMIEKEIVDLLGFYKVEAIGFDFRFAHEMMNRLGAQGLPIINIPQNHAKLTPACGEFERIIIDHKLQHGGNPLLRYCIDNLAPNQNHKGEIMPDKARSGGRIDAVTAFINAIACSLAAAPVEEPEYQLIII